MNRPLTGAGLAPPAAAYAHAVVSSAGSRLVHTSGIVAVKPDGSVPGTVGDQAVAIWDTIAVLLNEAEMTMSDIVSVTTYVVAGEPLGEVMAARDRALDGHLAASTLVTVPMLAQPAWKMEIAVVAAAD